MYYWSAYSQTHQKIELKGLEAQKNLAAELRRVENRIQLSYRFSCC